MPLTLLVQPFNHQHAGRPAGPTALYALHSNPPTPLSTLNAFYISENAAMNALNRMRSSVFVVSRFCRAVLAMALLCVCVCVRLSVCLSHACIVSTRLNGSSVFLTYRFPSFILRGNFSSSENIFTIIIDKKHKTDLSTRTGERKQNETT